MEQKCKVYEQEIISELTEDVIRPGGLDLTDQAMAFCRFHSGAKILDVGCGNGVTVEYLIKKYKLKAMGIDPSEVLINRGLKSNPHLTLLKGYGEKLPFSDHKMDGLLAECSLSVMEDMDKALGEFQRVLKEDGKLIISDLYIRSSAPNELKDLPFYCCVNGALPRQELEKKLNHHGFHVVFWEDCTEHLRRMVFELIMHYGSVEMFWSQMVPKDTDCKEVNNTIMKAKLGYFLLIAEKSSLNRRMEKG